MGLTGAWLAGKQLYPPDWGVLVETKLTMSQQPVLTAKKVTSLPGCIRLSVASRSREGILPFCSALVGHFQVLGPVWAPQYERDMDTLERVQQRATKVMKRLEHLTHERG